MSVPVGCPVLDGTTAVVPLRVAPEHLDRLVDAVGLSPSVTGLIVTVPHTFAAYAHWRDRDGARPPAPSPPGRRTPWAGTSSSTPPHGHAPGGPPAAAGRAAEPVDVRGGRRDPSRRAPLIGHARRIGCRAQTGLDMFAAVGVLLADFLVADERLG